MTKSSDIERAKLILSKGYTCVLVKDETEYMSTKTGIAPMLEFIESGVDLTGFSVADKIVGKAVALLFAKTKINEVYAEIISESAIEVLNNFKIKFSFKSKTEKIINKSNTGICPMEETVLKINDPNTAYDALKNKLLKIKKITKVVKL